MRYESSSRSTGPASGRRGPDGDRPRGLDSDCLTLPVGYQSNDGRRVSTETAARSLLVSRTNQTGELRTDEDRNRMLTK